MARGNIRKRLVKFLNVDDIDVSEINHRYFNVTIDHLINMTSLQKKLYTKHFNVWVYTIPTGYNVRMGQA